MITGCTFAILTTSDMERSRRFFTEQLGLTTDEEKGDTFSQFASTDGIPWAIMQTPVPGETGVEIYVSVDDVDACYAEWSAKGVKMLTEPHDEPFGRTFMFLDPDGHHLHALKAS